VVAGVGRALDAIERSGSTSTPARCSDGGRRAARCDWLATYRFSGDVWGYAEGEAYFPYSPLLIVEATFAEAVLLETLLLSIYNHDSAIASAASRMTLVAGDRPCIEMGSRRTHEEAAVRLARAAYVAGFATSSNLAARERYGVPTAGTSAHSFTLLHDTEEQAFRAQVHALGKGTTLLVDTYDVAEAVRLGVEVAGPGLGAVRLDSGDLGVLAEEVRAQLDSLGATETRIIVTSDLDEHAIAALGSAPVDGYGVGTQLVTGSGHPTCGFVYKLVAREDDAGTMVSVAKRSKDKISIGGRKYALRRRSASGVAEAELVGIGEPPRMTATTEPLLVPLVRDGEVVGREPLDTARARHGPRGPSCPQAAQQMSRGDRSSRPFTREPRVAYLTCDLFSEVLQVGTSISVILRRPSRTRSGSPAPASTGRLRSSTSARTHRRPDGLAPLHLRRPVRRGRGAGRGDAAVHHSFYADEVHGHRYWAYVSDELPSLVQSFFRVLGPPLRDVRRRLSMGGYGALKLALTHPNGMPRPPRSPGARHPLPDRP
jgi:nicotinate phosphoribosyltransferase